MRGSPRAAIARLIGRTHRGGCATAARVLPYAKQRSWGIMRHIMVLNSKGGCGKSTLATNIAVFFARDGHKVCIADYDPQRSSLDWLAERPADLPAISGVAAYEDGLRNVRAQHRDPGHRCAGARARHRAQRAGAARRDHHRAGAAVERSTSRPAAISWRNCSRSARCRASRRASRSIANRVREYTLIYEELDQYLSQAQGPVSRRVCARRRTTCAPTRAAWACWSCRNISPGPTGSSGSRSASGSTASAASPECRSPLEARADARVEVAIRERDAEFVAHAPIVDAA